MAKKRKSPPYAVEYVSKEEREIIKLQRQSFESDHDTEVPYHYLKNSDLKFITPKPIEDGQYPEAQAPQKSSSAINYFPFAYRNDAQNAARFAMSTLECDSKELNLDEAENKAEPQSSTIQNKTRYATPNAKNCAWLDSLTQDSEASARETEECKWHQKTSLSSFLKRQFRRSRGD